MSKKFISEIYFKNIIDLKKHGDDKMTLVQMKYIIEVVNSGSITEAARNLYISQPSLSSAIKEIEQEIGIQIFQRSTKGITLTTEGTEFLSYARQVVEQAELMEQRYLNKKPRKKICSVSTQHYSFAVNAFVNAIQKLDSDEYDFTLRETRTYEIIDDVRNFRSEVGILYLSDFNEKVIRKILKENHLEFFPLFTASPHVFISSNHPLAGKKKISLSELDEYPLLCFEQGKNNSFYFSEELFSTRAHKKTINVSDRATLFNLLIGLNGFTVCSGILNSNLNGDNIVSVELDENEKMLIGYIKNENAGLSFFAQAFIEELFKGER